VGDADFRGPTWVTDVPGGIIVAAEDVGQHGLATLVGQLSEWDRRAIPRARDRKPVL